MTTNKILLDVGANVGLYTDANFDKFDTFILVEANPALAEKLKNKYKNKPNCHIVSGIVSNKEKETFYIANVDTISTADIEWVEKSRFSNTTVFRWHPIEGIPTITLDNIISTYGEPSLLKIDVEGYEYNVLLSLTKKIPMLCFEWSEEKKEELLLTLEHLQKLGFTKYYIQYKDEYTFRVKDNEWEDYSTVYNLINSKFIITRKDLMGMVWAC